MLKEIGIYDSRVSEYLSSYPDTKFTFILKRWDVIPEYVNPWFDNIGVQIAVGVPQFIFSHVDFPVFWTSANLSGTESIYSFNEIQNVFWKEKEIIFIRAWELPVNPPSTIIDLTEASVKILRWTLK